MLTKLRAKNFKSWKDTGELELAPLTGLFGSNSSGKTSILQMLLMLKQTVESPDRRRVLHTGDERSLVDLGTYFDLIHGHQENASLDFSYSWNVVKPIVIYDPEQLNKELFSISDFTFVVLSPAVAPDFSVDACFSSLPVVLSTVFCADCRGGAGARGLGVGVISVDEEGVKKSFTPAMNFFL